MLYVLLYEYVSMVSRVQLFSSEIDKHLQQQANKDQSFEAYCHQHELKDTNFKKLHSNRRRNGEMNSVRFMELIGASTSSQSGFCSGSLILLYNPNLRVWLYDETSNMRKQFDGLAALAKNQMNAQIDKHQSFLPMPEVTSRFLLCH